MKALTVRQPWAWAIIYANKNIENRVWPIHYRGDILIHAAQNAPKKNICKPKNFVKALVFPYQN